MKPYDLSQYMHRVTLPSGAGLMGFSQSQNYAAGTVGEAIKNLGAGGGGGGGGSGVVTTSYVYNPDIVAAPATGEVRFDAAPPNTATSLKLHQTTTDNIDAGLAYSYLGPGQRVYIQDADDPTRFIKLTVVGPPVDQGAWWFFPVLVTEATVPSLLAERVTIGWPTSAAPGSGIPVNYVPKSAGAGGLVASQIYDGGTNVGIGTDTPQAKLHVAGHARIDNNLNMGQTLATGLGMAAGDYAAIELGANRASIGGALLDMHTTAASDYEFRISRGPDTNGAVSLENIGTGGFSLTQIGAGEMAFATNNTRRMTITSLGSVGINTVVPDIFGTGLSRVLGISASPYAGLSIGGATAGGSASINMGNNGAVAFNIITAAGGYTSLTTIGAVPMTLGTNNLERVRIGAGGNVGVANSNPQAPLHVGGDFRVGIAGDPNTYNLRIYPYSPSGGTINYEFRTLDATFGDRCAFDVTAYGEIVVGGRGGGSGNATVTINSAAGLSSTLNFGEASAGKASIFYHPPTATFYTDANIHSFRNTGGAPYLTLAGGTSVFDTVLAVKKGIQLQTGHAGGGLWFMYNDLSIASRTWVFAPDTNTYGDFAFQRGNDQAGNSFSHVWYVDVNKSFFTYGPVMKVNQPDVGTVGMRASGVGNAGYIEFFDNTNARVAYIGNQVTPTGHISYVNERSGGHVFNGQIACDNTVTATAFIPTSDKRLKKNIVDALDPGAIIDAIRVRSFDFRKGGRRVLYGVIAQELQAVAPEYVVEGIDEEKTLGVDLVGLVGTLLREAQLLRARMAHLEGHIHGEPGHH